MSKPQPRIRRSKEESQRLILEAAEALLAKGGPGAVQVRAVANVVGITDAAINHHFGTRDQLLKALLRHGGRRLKTELAAAIHQWQKEGFATDLLIQLIFDLYADAGYAELALGLHRSGWRSKGAGMLEPVVEALHQARCEASAQAKMPPPAMIDTQFAVATMHQALALDPIFGEEFRRSAGITKKDDPSDEYKVDWWRKTIEKMIQGCQ